LTGKETEKTMNKKLIVIAGLVVLALALTSLALAGPALAQNPTPPAPGYGPGYGSGMMGGNYGYGRGLMMRGIRTSGAYGPMHDTMLNALAEGLNLSREDLDGRITAGETPAQIAAAQGLSTEEFAQIFAEARKAAMDKAVADGYLTQEQVDWMLSRMAGRGFAGNCPMHPSQTNP
jgi:hypothetical protein